MLREQLSAQEAANKVELEHGEDSDRFACLSHDGVFSRACLMSHVSRYSYLTMFPCLQILTILFLADAEGAAISARGSQQGGAGAQGGLQRR